MAEYTTEHLSLEHLVDAAAARIVRLEPRDACRASKSGGLVVDIRSQDARELNGIVPGSLHIPRTVLEWRVARDSEWRSPYIDGPGQQLILICDHGYSSILAASNMVSLGFSRACDVIGGFEAWARHGLPVARVRRRLPDADVLPGMGPPE